VVDDVVSLIDGVPGDPAKRLNIGYQRFIVRAAGSFNALQYPWPGPGILYSRKVAVIV